MEICDQMESATPQQILEKARDESTELHKCFTWDDSIAAEKYRIQEARQIVCQFCRNELLAVKQKYQNISEYEEVWELIN